MFGNSVKFIMRNLIPLNTKFDSFLLVTMRNLIITILFFGLTFAESFAQTKPPRFEDYSISSTFKGKPARVNLRSHPQARMFRTVLRSIAKQGANFGGHFAIDYWGCGTQCLRIGIVDLKTGRAYVAPFYTGFGISYRADSRLLIVEPPEATKDWLIDGKLPDYLQPRYYVWRNNRLVLIYPKEAQNDEAEKFWQ